MFDINDDMYFKFNDTNIDLDQDIKVFSSDGDRVDLFTKKEHVKGNINNKLRKIIIDNTTYYYLDVKLFKTIEEYDDAFLLIVKDFDVVSIIYDKKMQLAKQKELLESNKMINKEDFGD